MLAYAIRRILAAIPVMGVVALLVFSLLYLTPGDPAMVIAGDQATPDEIARIRVSLGLDQAPYLRFANWAWHVVHGDLGTSIFSGQAVTHVIEQRLEPTISLILFSLLISVGMAIPFGVAAAWSEGKWIDHLSMIFTVLGFSVPVFVVGYLLAYIFATTLHWLPVQGYVPLGGGIGPFLSDLILPAATLGVPFAAIIVRVTRSAMLEVLSQDYIRTAVAKGLTPRGILFRHALKNASIPIVTIVGIGIATLVGATVVVESVFGIPGLGRLTVDAILHRDYPVIQAVVLLSSVSYVAVNLAVDLLYTALDPRIRYSTRPRSFIRFARRRPKIFVGGGLLTVVAFLSVFAPWLGTVDPLAVAVLHRLRPPSAAAWFGTDQLGRDLYSRVLYGGRISLLIGVTVALIASMVGTVVGLICASGHWPDAIIMRLMDGVMAIPAILLAIALMAVAGNSVKNVIIALTVVEAPRVARNVRGVALSLREQPYVEAAVAAGSSRYKIMIRHIFPGIAPPLIVQATFVWATAMVIEATLSFVGAGTPPSQPSWGNIMAEGRMLWQVKPFLVFIPAAFLSITLLAVNMVGDGLRDLLDPRMARWN